MGDRIAYYKNVRIGDFLNGPEAVSAKSEPIQFQSSLWANRAAPIERGANATYATNLTFTMQRSFSGSETVRDFSARKLAFLVNILNATGFGSGNIYSQAGTLAIIEDEATDAALLVELSGANVFKVAVGDGSKFATSDVVLLASSVGAEIVLVESVTGGTVNVSSMQYAHPIGGVAAVVLWYLPSCYCTQTPTVEGVTAGTHDVSRNMTVEFQGADDPVSYI